MKATSQVVNKIILVTLSLTLFIACYQAIKMTEANLTFYKATSFEQHWLKNNVLNNKDQFATAINAINSSTANHLDNPRYLAAQGLIHEWAGISTIFTKEEQQKQLLLAKKSYLEAVELRPAWPTTWATLAILKWRLNEIDQDLIDYLFQADKFGPNVDDVHNAWLDIGFYLYKTKSHFTIQIIKKLRLHLNRVAKNNRPSNTSKAISIIKRHNAQRLACAWLSNYNDNNFSKKLCTA